MTDENQTGNENNANAEFLRKKKAKEEALMRYINEPESNIYDELMKNSSKTSLKEAICGFFYTLYVIFLHPILSDHTLKRKIILKLIFGVMMVVIMMLYFQDFYSPPNETEKNLSESVIPRP